MQAGVTPGFEKSRGNLKERFIQLLFEEKFEADTYFVLLKHYQNVNYLYLIIMFFNLNGADISNVVQY